MTPDVQTADAPTDVKHTWREIQEVVQQVTRLARASVESERFFSELLDHSVRIMAAIGGAVWLKRHDGLVLEYQINLGKTGVTLGPDNADAATVEERESRHLALLNHISTQSQSRAIAPLSGRGGSDSNTPSNPTEYLLLLSPIAIDERVLGIIEIFQRPDVSPAACQGFVRFLGALADLAADYLRNSRLRELQDRASLWSDFERFTERVHAGLDPQQIALVMANDGRQLIGCDRVMVAVPRGSKARVVAVSGSDAIDRRSNVIRAAEELIRRVAATRKPFWFDDASGGAERRDDLPPQLDRALHEHLDASASRLIAVLPLIAPPSASAAESDKQPKSAPLLGALLIESFSGVEHLTQLKHRADVVARQSAIAVSNATLYSNLPFLWALRLLGRLGWHLRLRQLPRTIFVLGTLVAAIAALFLVPADFTIDGRGELQPVMRRGIFATSDGIVASLSSKLQGNEVPTVDADESLLELTNAALDFELTRTTGELQTSRQKLNTTQVERLNVGRNDPNARAKTEQLAAQEQELGETIKSLSAQLDVLKKQQANLVQRSPIHGQILTWDAAQLLQNRPVRQGEKLLEVANVAGEWQLEVQVADQNIGYINAARRDLKTDLDVAFVLATDPEVTYHGTLRDVSREVRLDPELGPSVLVTVSVPRSAMPQTHLRPGATVIPHIHCGRRPIGFVWFHELIHAIYSRLLF